MNINKEVDVKDITLADIHAVLYETEQDFYDSVKNGDFKGAIQLAKRYFEMNRLLLKRISYVNKNGINVTSEPDEVQRKIAEEIRKIMAEIRVDEDVNRGQGRK